MVFATPVIEIIFPLKCYILREYLQIFFENFTFYEFLMKNVVFRVIFASFF